MTGNPIWANIGAAQREFS